MSGLGPEQDVVPIVISVLVGLAVMLATLAIAARHRARKRSERVDLVLRFSGARPAVPIEVGPVEHDSAERAVNRLLVRLPHGDRTPIALDNAGLSWSPATWLLVRIAAAVVVAIGLLLLGLSPLLAVILGLLVGFLGGRLLLSSRAKERRDQFQAELPDFLLVVSSSLRAGLSFLQALESAAEEGDSEVHRQMRRALAEVQLGATQDDALMGVADRMQSQDMHWAVIALRLGRSIGGNFSRVLDSVADTVRRRADVQRQLTTLSAEGRTSAFVMVLMPILIFGFLFVTQRDYVATMWTTTAGLVMLGLAIVLILVGWLWARALGKVRM